MSDALYVLNFYSAIFVDQLKRGRKTATIRLGDKSRKYKRGQVVWVTVGFRHQPAGEDLLGGDRRRRGEEGRGPLARATSSTTTPSSAGSRTPSSSSSKIYTRPISMDDTVTVIRFSQIVERPSTQFGNGEPPSPN